MEESVLSWLESYTIHECYVMLTAFHLGLSKSWTLATEVYGLLGDREIGIIEESKADGLSLSHGLCTIKD